MRFDTIMPTLRAATAALMNIATQRVRPSTTTLAPGEMAPDFNLPASDGRTYRLRDFRGRRPVVLAWFPKAFTGGCTAECRSLGEMSATLRGLNVQPFAASVDSVETNTRFAESLGLDFPVLSDTTREVARAYGVLTASGFASRHTFYIGTDGRITAIDTSVRTSTHGRDVAERVKTLDPS